MKFYDYIDILTHFNASPERREANKMSREELYDLVDMLIDNEIPEAFNNIDKKTRMLRLNMCNNIKNTLIIEDYWAESGKPYYDVYPSVSEFIGDLNLEFNPDQLSTPHNLKALLLKFYENHDPKYVLFSLNKKDDSVIFSYVVDINYADVGIDLMQFSVAVSKDDTINSALNSTFNSIFANHELTDSELIYVKKRWDQIVKILKIILSVCLIGDDPELIDPQVLTKDLPKVNPNNIKKLVDKARRRGKFGFSFGKSLEMIPHLRRPHMYWQAYGPKHSLRRYTKRKGSIIHKDVITNVPTGFEKR